MGKHVTVYWKDAVAYQKYQGGSFVLKNKITKGELFLEDRKFIVIKNPKTYELRKSWREWFPSFLTLKKAKFFSIPKGMIQKVQK